jgi:hypothetical protein
MAYSGESYQDGWYYGVWLWATPISGNLHINTWLTDSLGKFGAVLWICGEHERLHLISGLPGEHANHAQPAAVLIFGHHSTGRRAPKMVLWPANS